MPASGVLAEFRTAWLPKVSDSGLDRIIELLRTGSPLLIHGTFTRCVPLGCIASHIAWHHPETRHLNVEAGITWLTRVARLNPATSKVLLAWDRRGAIDWDLRAALLDACEHEQRTRGEHSEAACGELAAV